MNKEALTLFVDGVRKDANAKNEHDKLILDRLHANNSSEEIITAIVMNLDDAGQRELYKKAKERVEALYDRLMHEPLTPDAQVGIGRSPDGLILWRAIDFGEEFGQLDIHQHSRENKKVYYRAIQVGGLPRSVDKGIPHDERILLRLKERDMPEGSDLLDENCSLLSQYESLCKLCKLIGIAPKEDYDDFLKNEYSGLLSTVKPSSIDGA